MEKLFHRGQRQGESLEQEKTLEEDGIYVCRHGKLEKLPRTQDDGLRRIRITDDAYQAAMDLGHQLRKELHGYKPDVSLVASALILEGCRDMHATKAKEVIGGFVIKLFQPTS